MFATGVATRTDVKPLGLIPGEQAPRLFDAVVECLRVRHYSLRTERAYLEWIKRFILFHNRRHPAEMGAVEINRFLTSLAVEGHVAASTQNQAFSALLYLYQKVLEVNPGRIEGVIRANRPKRLPVVLTKDEVRRVIEQLDGVYALMAQLLYGSGLRLLECLRLRVKDLDFSQNEVTVREGKGDKDRRTMLAESAKPGLALHLDRVRKLHQRELEAGLGSVEMPTTLERKLPGADRSWLWQYVFPSANLSTDPQRGSFGVITCMKERSVARSQTPSVDRVSKSEPPATASGTALRPTYLKPATTSAPSKNYWGTRMCRRR